MFDITLILIDRCSKLIAGKVVFLPTLSHDKQYGTAMMVICGIGERGDVFLIFLVFCYFYVDTLLAIIACEIL